MSVYPQPTTASYFDRIDELPACLVLYSRLVAEGTLSSSQWDRLRFWTARAAALRTGENPPALWLHLLGLSELPGTLADEDAAHRTYHAAKRLTRAPADSQGHPRQIIPHGLIRAICGEGE